ncbi:MAG: DegT/DnrJ/EryC1/StrS family aminotransferase, partial [Candidatus Paceibacterota bacterium]
MTVPFYRPPPLNTQLLKSAAEGMRKTGMVSNSALCRDFEAAVKDYHNVRYALACSSATTGLILALRALRARTGAKECIMPSFTWKSCLVAAECAGLRPMFADIELNGWAMEPVTRNEIIMPVSIFGASIRNSDYKGHVLL